jgi:hypothetical protein
MARPRAVLDCVACAIVIHTFVSIAGRPAVRRCAWLEKYIAMRLFQLLNASPFAPREYSHRRMSRGQADMEVIQNPVFLEIQLYCLMLVEAFFFTCHDKLLPYLIKGAIMLKNN